MNLILLGPQGSGKGTQAEILVEKYGLNYFEAGKILRSIPEIRQTLNRGELVPEEYVRLIAWDFINKHDRNKGFLFDGYPRSVAQYDHLQDMLKKFGKRVDLVINIGIPEEESVRRLSARRMCTKCGEIYNLVTEDKPDGNECAKCGGDLYQREDDKPEAVRRRLEIYRDQTHPVFEKALGEGIGIEVNGMQSILDVAKEIERVINEKVNA